MRITNEQRVTAIHEYHAALGRNGGAAKSPAKTAAARRNIAVRWAKRRAAGGVPVGQTSPEALTAGLAPAVAPPEAGGRAETAVNTQDGIAGTWTTPEAT